jgi:hypothetical protein
MQSCAPKGIDYCYPRITDFFQVIEAHIFSSQSKIILYQNDSHSSTILTSMKLSRL